MADREKVIKGMTELKKYLPSTMWEPINNAIASLKEQDAIVRCKDCVHYCYYGLTADTVSECVIGHCENPDRDWFCADGERR